MLELKNIAPKVWRQVSEEYLEKLQELSLWQMEADNHGKKKRAVVKTSVFALDKIVRSSKNFDWN